MPHTLSCPSRRHNRSTVTSWAATLIFTLTLLPWTILAQTTKTAADYFVHSLPGAPEPLLKMYAGHVEITPAHHGNMFFWLYKNRHLADRPRTVLWLNGGPGCSSMDGALMEIGPYRINEDGTLRYNDGSWDAFANLLFVDNPVGTGFSYVDGDSLVHELDEMAEQMMAFLETWFGLFPEHMHDDLYIAGESYAGQHIPYIAEAIRRRNAGRLTHDVWNLKGLLIGNGWFDGPDQYFSYIPMLYEAGLLEKGSDADRNARDQEDQCRAALADGGKDLVDVNMCEMIMHVLNRDLLDRGHCPNVYDVRLSDTYPACGMNWPPDLTQMTPYLRRKDVHDALHVNSDKVEGWHECDGQVSSAFSARNSRPSSLLLPGLLEDIPIVLFAGDKDFICNHIGIETVIANLQWNGATGMEQSETLEWTVQGEAAGQWQTARNLTYVRFYNASHMVPFDHASRTRDMLDRFMGITSRDVGKTIDSHIDGEDLDETIPSDQDSMPAPPTDNAPIDDTEQARLEAATWAAYQRSGEAALVVVLIAAGLAGFFIYRDRARRRKGYLGVFAADPYDDNGGAGERRERSDIENAAAFDEAELDNLTANGRHHRKDEDRFGLADDEESEDERRPHGKAGERRGNGGLGFKDA